MAFQFTPAAERALVAAAQWSSSNTGRQLEPPELLVGLLAEPECRAALILAGRHIDAEIVRSRWGLRRRDMGVADETSFSFSRATEESLSAAEERLWGHPRPLWLATEHLLLGLLAGPHEVADWLAEQGLSADALEAEINRPFGGQHELGLAADDDARPLAPSDALSAIAPAVTARAGMPPVQPADQENRDSRASGPRRIMDAAANRAREGLRVIEDYVRFILDDRYLTGELKQARHDLTAILARFSESARLGARETLSDVGTSVTTAGELVRADLAAVVTANFKRLQESLRSLEEYGKLYDAAAGAALEQLRYRTYTLERAIAATRTSVQRLALSRLYVLVDGRSSEANFCALVESLVSAGVHLLQLRDKTLADRELIGRARHLRELTRGTGTLFVMNDRADLAVLVHADGVHVGQDELSVKDARSIVGPGVLVGVSTHSLAQARQAVLDGADYIGVGPIFASATKRFDPDQLTGVALLQAVTSEIQLPAFAIGGIDRQNLPQVLAAGCRRASVSGAILGAADAAAAARELLALL